MKVRKAWIDNEGKEISFDDITGFKTRAGNRGVYNYLINCWIMINPTASFEAVSFEAEDFDELEKEIKFFNENDFIEKITTRDDVSTAILASLDEVLNE